ncbi:MAG: solute carrier family 23 protein [Bacilli bacterium]|jgi:uracil permease|nr:solute carrier family 23 protein [Bacilli bacterium]
MILGVKDRPSFGKWLVLSLQHVFAMFGATILVPLLTGLDTGVALLTSGVGTLIYILCTKGKVPIYLGSSFAYIAAVTTAVSLGGFSAAFVGIILVGLIYIAIALIIKFTGTKWLHHLLPPVVIGPMIIIIGLGLAPVAIGNIGLTGTFDWKVFLVATVTFVTTVLVALKAKGFLKVIPFIVAIGIGYALSAVLGIVDWTVFEGIHFFQLPNFTIFGTYELNFSALLIFLPLSFVTISEHIGDHVVLSEIVGTDFLTEPGLDKTLMGDGVATLFAGLIGGPANTSYGENTSVVGITKVASVWVTGLAAVIAILLGFFGYIQAFIASIPWAVIGGITVVLYGFIAGNGVKVLVKNRVDLGNIRNLIIVATMLVLGLGGATISFNAVAGLSGMSLAAIIGIILNLALPYERKES